MNAQRFRWTLMVMRFYLVLFALVAGALSVAAATTRVRTTVIFKGSTADGRLLIQPIFTPQFVVEEIGEATETQRRKDGGFKAGTAARCEAFVRAVRVIEVDGNRGVLHETVLDCDGSLLAIRGLILDPIKN